MINSSCRQKWRIEAGGRRFAGRDSAAGAISVSRGRERRPGEKREPFQAHSAVVRKTIKG